MVNSMLAWLDQSKLHKRTRRAWRAALKSHKRNIRYIRIHRDKSAWDDFLPLPDTIIEY